MLTTDYFIRDDTQVVPYADYFIRDDTQVVPYADYFTRDDTQVVPYADYFIRDDTQVVPYALTPSPQACKSADRGQKNAFHIQSQYYPQSRCCEGQVKYCKGRSPPD